MAPWAVRRCGRVQLKRKRKRRNSGPKYRSVAPCTSRSTSPQIGLISSSKEFGSKWTQWRNHRGRRQVQSSSGASPLFNCSVTCRQSRPLLSSTGKEQVRVSRRATDAFGVGTDFSKAPKFTEAVAKGVGYGPVYFRGDTSEPYMILSVAGPRPYAG